MSWSMSDTVAVTVYYEYNGVIYQGPSMETSVREQALIKKADSNARDICVAMLNYGAAVQVAFNHCSGKEEYLANYGLTDEEKTVPSVVFGNSENVYLPAGKLQPSRSSLNMQAKVVMQFPILIDDFSNYEVRYTVDGGEETVLPASGITNSTVQGKEYRVINIAVAALNMRSEYRISIYNKTTGEYVYGDIVCSVADSAARFENNATYHNVAATMLAYGDAVAAQYGK